MYSLLLGDKLIYLSYHTNHIWCPTMSLSRLPCPWTLTFWIFQSNSSHQQQSLIFLAYKKRMREKETERERNSSCKWLMLLVTFIHSPVLSCQITSTNGIVDLRDGDLPCGGCQKFKSTYLQHVKWADTKLYDSTQAEECVGLVQESILYSFFLC